MNKFIFFLFSLMLLAVILFLDGYLFPQGSLTVLYLIPVLLASVYIGLGAGLALSVSSAVAGTLWGQKSVTIASFNPALAWSLVSTLVMFGLISFLSARLRGMAKQQERTAGIDPLTGLRNLNCFLERSQEEMHRSRRTRKPLSLAYIDIDGLKKVNDLLGFVKGDQLLKDFAQDLRKHTRASDISARLGGDEFVILFPEAGVEQARGAATKIQKSFQVVARQIGCQVTISLGLVTVFNPEIKLEEVMNKAFDLLMEAKRQGDNNIKDGTLG